MTDIKRHIVWACFGVDATSPEQAKRVVNRIVGPDNKYRQGVYDKGKVNVVVFTNPALDELFNNRRGGER